MLIKGLQAGQTTFNKAKFLEKGRMHQRESDGGLSSPGNQRRIRDFCMHQPISQINTQFWAPVEPIILIQARVRFKPGSRQGVYTAPDIGGQGARDQGPPPKRAPHHVHVVSHMCDMCVKSFTTRKVCL